MNKTVWIVLGVIALVIFWGVGSRNSMATSDQDVKDAFGMGITLVTSAKTPEETLSFLEFIGVPLKKED